MSALIADYDEPRRLFEQLWQPGCQQRIVLWQGEGGCGKTTLMNHCLGRIPESVSHVPIQMRSNAVTVAEIFNRFVRVLGGARLPQFARRVATLTGTPDITIDHNWLVGINNRISVSLQAASVQEQEQRQAALTEALFADLEGSERPMLVAVDTYEQATTTVKDWLEGPFLSRVPWVEPVRVLLAGQLVPDPNSIEWQRSCAYQELLGVREAQHWLPVVEALGRVIPPMDWLAGLCFGLDGRPSEILMAIERLPRQVGAR